MKEEPARRHIWESIEHHDTIFPIEAPCRPSPAKTTKESNPDCWSKRNVGRGNPWPIKVARIRNKRSTVDQPRVIDRQVTDIRVRRLYYDRWSFIDDPLLRVAL